MDNEISRIVRESEDTGRSAESSSSAGTEPVVKIPRILSKDPVKIIRPKYEQPSLVTGTDSGASVTHAHTTLPPSQARSQNGTLYSYASERDIQDYVQELYGRTWNTLNEAYILPTDEPEWIRLDKQHSAFLIGFGGLYPCPEIVEPLLSTQDNGEPLRILDVGCGTGSWAIEMAHRFPHALVLGIDVAPVPCDSSLFPPNVSFEIDNINYGLSHYQNQYSLVHMRCVGGGIADMARTMEDLENCLVPGGLLIVIDGDVQLRDEHDMIVKPIKIEGDEDVSGVSKKGSWFVRMAWEAMEACQLAGSTPDISMELMDYGPWNDPLCDPESTVVGSLYLPIGPWAEGSTPTETQMLRYAGILMQQSFLNVHTAFHPIMIKQGMDQETLNEWSRHIHEELTKMTPKMWVRFRFLWTRRRQDKGLPAPPLPPTNSSTPPSVGSEPTTHGPVMPNIERPRYPAIEFYHTLEETMARKQQRRASAGVLPQSAVERAWIRMQSNPQNPAAMGSEPHSQATSPSI